MDSSTVPEKRSQSSGTFCRTVIIGVVAWSLFGCLGMGSAKENLSVYADSTFRVALESDPNITSDQSIQHDHPVEFTLPEIKLLLTGLEAERDQSFLKSILKEKERMPVFSSEETNVLAPHVQKALGQVLPPERVTFKVSYPSKSDDEKVTSGSIWVRGDHVFISLDRYRSSTKPPQSAIPGPYDSSFSRRSSSRHQHLPDYSVYFSPNQAVVKKQLNATTQMFAFSETQITIDRQRLAKIPTDVSFGVHTLSSSQGNPAKALSADTCAKQLEEMETKVRDLTNRVQTQEAQISDLLGIVKKLTNSQPTYSTPPHSGSTR